MHNPITATLITASLLGLLYFYTSLQTILRRRKSKSPWRPKNDDVYLKAHVAAHSNFAAYTPIFLFLLLLLEYSWPKLCWGWLVVGVLFWIGRTFHFLGMTRKETAQPPSFKWRQFGMYITLWSLFLMGLGGLLTPLLKMYF